MLRQHDGNVWSSRSSRRYRYRRVHFIRRLQFPETDDWELLPLGFVPLATQAWIERTRIWSGNPSLLFVNHEDFANRDASDLPGAFLHLVVERLRLLDFRVVPFLFGAFAHQRPV